MYSFKAINTVQCETWKYVCAKSIFIHTLKNCKRSVFVTRIFKKNRQILENLIMHSVFRNSRLLNN